MVEAHIEKLIGFEVGLSEDGRVQVSMQNGAVILRMTGADAARLAKLVDSFARRALGMREQ